MRERHRERDRKREIEREKPEAEKEREQEREKEREKERKRKRAASDLLELGDALDGVVHLRRKPPRLLVCHHPNIKVTV